MAAISIIEEATVSWRTMTKVHSEFSLHSLTENVSTGMPEDHLAFWVVEENEFQLAVTFKGSEGVIELPEITVAGILFIWIDKSFI